MACSALNTQWGFLPIVPPQLLVAEGLGQVTTLVGQPLDLPCQASGSPAPTIQCVWGGGTRAGGMCGQRTHALGVGVGTGDTSPSKQYGGATEPGWRCCWAWLVLLLRLPWPQAALPLPTHLRWLQNGRPAEELAGVQMASHGTTLHIDRVERGHAGLFSCQATNEAGTAGAEVELSVHGEGAWEARTASGGSGGPGRDVELVLSGQCFWAGLPSSPKGCDMRGWSWPFTTVVCLSTGPRVPLHAGHTNFIQLFKYIGSLTSEPANAIFLPGTFCLCAC